MGRRTTQSVDDERGAALVEFAILIPLLAMLLLGIVSAGLAFGHQLSLTHSAREAGRYAATLPVSNFSTLGDWLTNVADRAVADASGALDTGVAGRTICVAYVYPAGNLATDKTTTLTRDPVGTDLVDSTSGNPCFADGRGADERRVQVQVERQAEFGALLFTATLTLDSQAVSRYEAGPGL